MNKWWGYRHSNRSYQVKRYFGEIDIIEAKQSSFVEQVYGPFEAENREDALEKLKYHIG
jgi:hypothetical protein